MAITVTPRDDGYELAAFVANQLDPAINASAIKKAMQDIAQAYAEEWVIDNLDQIYAQLDVKAISNLIMVEVAKQVKDKVLSDEPAQR